jgi:hypothetical protein
VAGSRAARRLLLDLYGPRHKAERQRLVAEHERRFGKPLR